MCREVYDTGREVLQGVVFHLEEILQIISALLNLTLCYLLNLLCFVHFLRAILKCGSSGDGIFVSIDDGNQV